MSVHSSDISLRAQSADDITDSLGGASPVSTDVDGASPRSAFLDQHPAAAAAARVPAVSEAASAAGAATSPLPVASAASAMSQLPDHGSPGPLIAHSEAVGGAGILADQAALTSGSEPSSSAGQNAAMGRSGELQEPASAILPEFPHFQVIGEALFLLCLACDSAYQP